MILRFWRKFSRESPEKTSVSPYNHNHLTSKAGCAARAWSAQRAVGDNARLFFCCTAWYKKTKV